MSTDEAADVPAEHAPGHEAARDAWGLLALGIVAAIMRAIAWQRTAVLFNDGPIFLALARALAEGRLAEVLLHPYHPLYPATIAALAWLPIELESAAIVVSILGGLLSVVAIFWLVRAAFDRLTAWLSAWIVALHPWALDFSSDVMSDGLYCGLFLVGFAAMAALVARPSVTAAMLCALASGLAYLVRPEGAGLPILAFGLLLLRALSEPGLRPRVIRSLAVLVLGSLLVIGPYVAFVARETGEIALTRKKSLTSLAGGVERPSERPAADAGPSPVAPLPLPEFATRSDGPGARRPERSGRGLLETVGRVTRTSLAAFRYELFFFALLGLWSLRGRASPIREATIGLPIVAYSVVLMLLVWGAGYVSRRHALAAWLPAVAFSALGWRWLCETLAARARARGSGLLSRLDQPRVICLTLAAVLVLVWGPRDLRVRRADRAPVRAAAEWLARQHPDSGPVAAQKLRTAYYARAPFVPLPDGVDGRLEQQLRARGARWVVIDAAKLEDHRGLETGLGHWLRHTPHSSDPAGKVLILEVIP